MAQDNDRNITGNLGYDWQKLKLAGVAQEYLSQGKEGFPLAQRSLELLLQDIGFADPGIVKTITDPEVIQKTIDNELEVYRQGYSSQTVGDMINYHKGTLEKYLGGDAGKVKADLAQFLSTNYMEIYDAMNTANHTIEGKQKGVKTSEEDLKSAEATYKKYGKVYATISYLEQQEKSALRARVEDAIARDFFRNTYLSKPNKA